MQKLGKVISKIESFAKPSLAQFDYVGLLQGDLHRPVAKIGLTLDYSLQAIEKAIAHECDLLITHHGPTNIQYPLIGNNIQKIIAAQTKNLAVYRCHLNLDFCEGGIIDSLCTILKIPAKKTHLTYEGKPIYGGVNLVEKYPLTLAGLMRRVAVLKSNSIRIAGLRREKFSRIAITSGAGFFGEFMDQLSPEVYIAGEFEQEALKYAEDLGIMLVELTHHASEERPLDLVAPRLEKVLGISIMRIEIPDTSQVMVYKEQIC